MTNSQLRIVWVVGPLVSGTLFFSGIGRPYLVTRSYQERIDSVLREVEARNEIAFEYIKKGEEQPPIATRD